MPRISVIMPCFNSEKFLPESIESILSQTYADFEVFVLNEKRTDGTEELVKSYADTRIVYVEDPGHIGIAKTRNKGIGLSGGEFIAMMDSDDIAYPDRFQVQVDYLDSNPDVGVVGGWMDFFPTRQGDGHHKEFITYLDVLKGWCINNPTVMIRKKILDQFGLLYAEDCKEAEDYELWSRIIRYTKIVNIQRPLVRYRWHGGNRSTTGGNGVDVSAKSIKQNMLDFLTEDKECQRRIWKLFSSNEKWAEIEKILYS